MLVLKETGSRIEPASLPLGTNSNATAVKTKIDNRMSLILPSRLPEPYEVPTVKKKGRGFEPVLL